MMAALILPAGVSVDRLPRGASLEKAILDAGTGHRFEKSEAVKFGKSKRPLWARSYMLGHGGEGLGTFEWVHEEIVAVPQNLIKGGYLLYKFRTTSFDPVLKDKERAAWARFLASGAKGPARK